jgi:hypothetical protein
VVAALCIAVMSVEFWALNRIPEAAPAPETGGSVAVAPLAPPPSPAAPRPTGTNPVTMIVGTQEMAQALAVSDNPTAGSGVADHERSRQVLPRPTDVQRDKPGLRQQPVRVRVSHAVATAPTHVPKPIEVPATDAAIAASYKGVLLIDSMPAGARVFVDRQLVGFTPIALPNVTAGSRVVRLEADAHETWSSAVRIVADEETRLSVQLNRTTQIR